MARNSETRSPRIACPSSLARVCFLRFRLSLADIRDYSPSTSKQEQYSVTSYSRHRENSQPPRPQWFLCDLRAGLARWREHLPPTFVIWVRFLVSAWGLSLLVLYSALRSFSRVLRFSPLTTNQQLIGFVVIQFDLWSPQLVNPVCSAKPVRLK